MPKRYIVLTLPAFLGVALFILGLITASQGKEAIHLALFSTTLGGAFFSLAIFGASFKRPEKIARLAMFSSLGALLLFSLLAFSVSQQPDFALPKW